MSWLPWPSLLELAVVALAIAAAILWPNGVAAQLRTLGGRWPFRDRSLGTQLGFIAVFAILLRAAFLPWLGVPVPLIHDEQSLMLQAQTYLLGRLANPTHPLWPYFESHYINQLPAYASIYFPGRGVPMALGLWLFGNAWIGVWISFVLFAMATTWMLRGWVRPGWALIGGMIIVVRLGVASYWINGYFGIAHTALGAMLVVGAMPRLVKRPSWATGSLLGIGTLLLMTTRPFEGLLLCGGIGLFFLPRLLKLPAPQFRSMLLRAGLPLLVCVMVGGAAMALYNKATTGAAVLTAYQVNRSTYAVAPAFLVAKAVPDAGRRAPIAGHFARYYEYEALPWREAQAGAGGFLATVETKTAIIFAFYIGIALTIPFLLGAWRSRLDLPVIGTLSLFYAAFLLTTWPLPQYAAPLTPLLMIIIMRGLESLSQWAPRGRPVGYCLARLLPVATAAPLLVVASALLIGKPRLPNNNWDQACCALAFSSVRAQLIDRLEKQPGRDLVLVTSSEFNPIHSELVYNDADIEASPIVWAHSAGAQGDRQLIDHFADREVWRVEWLPAATHYGPNLPADAYKAAPPLYRLEPVKRPNPAQKPL